MERIERLIEAAERSQGQIAQQLEQLQRNTALSGAVSYTHLGFERRSKRIGGNPVYGWVIEKISPNPFGSYGL